LPHEDREVLVDLVGRVLEARADFADGVAEEAGGETEVVAEELVGVLGFDAVGFEGAAWEVALVACDDDIAAADDGGGEDVSVVGVGEREAGDEGFVAGDEAVARVADERLRPKPRRLWG